MRPEYAKLLEDIEASNEYWTHAAVLEFTEEIARLMEDEAVSRAELSRRIGKTAAYVTKVLRGNVNFTVETMTMLARAFDTVVRIHLAPSDVAVTWVHERSVADIRSESFLQNETAKYNIVKLEHAFGNQGAADDASATLRAVAG